MTVTENVLVSLNAGEPLSVTRTVMLVIIGPCASVGVHEKIPLEAPMLAPLGAPGSRENDRAFPSESVADAVKDKRVPSLITWFEIAVRTGA